MNTTNELPITVLIHGVEYKINSDFHTSMQFEDMILNEELSATDKLLKALMLYYPIIPSDYEEASEQIIKFYRGASVENKGSADKSGKRQYDYNHDFSYIYTDFKAQYNVDLYKVDYLHWWKFKALFKACLLNDSCLMHKVIQYRTIKITSEMTKQQKQFYSEMKKIYALPISEKLIQRSNAIEEALMHGGDLSNL